MENSGCGFYKTIILFGFLLSCLSVIAQTDVLKHLGIEDGLSNNSIVDITQDSRGLIWIATESGLNCFDGRNFTVYTKNNSGLVSNELNTILYDKGSDALWIGSQREGISVLDCRSRSFTNYNTGNDRLATNDVTHLSHAADGSGIWITHYHVGIEFYYKGTGQFTLFADQDIAGMGSLNWCACDDGNGFLYVGHTYDGMSIIDIRNRTARNFRHNPLAPASLPGNNVRSIFIDHQKNVWVGTDQGLALFNPQTEEFVTFRHDPLNPHSIGSNSIYHIMEMKDNTLWIGTDMVGISILNLNRIAFVNPNQIQFRKITPSPSDKLSFTSVRQIYQDSFDNIWIGHYRKGIDFISHTTPIFQTLIYTDPADETREKQIWDIFIDSESNLWIGSENQLSLFENGALQKAIDIRPYLIKDRPGVYINEIESDKKGNLWLGTNSNDVLRLNPRNHRIESIPLSEAGGYIHDFFEDAHEKMWIGTDNRLYSYRQGQIDPEKRINDQLTDKTIYSIVGDRQGKLWVGTFGKGIFVFEGDRLISNLVTDNGFCSNAVNNLYADSKGCIWAATRNGIACFENTENPSRYKVYNELQGIENPYVHAILEDQSGNLWFSTNSGISLWDGTRERFNNYSHLNGVPMGDFLNGAASLRKDGMMFWGSFNAVCYFNPLDVTKAQSQSVSVQITECLSLNNHIETKEKEMLVPSAGNAILLPYNKNSFRIVFAVPDYSLNPQVEYAYRMEGLENSWHNTLGDNQVTFRNISPGHYTFKVKTRLKNRDWDEENIASIDFVIHPPLWFTWYAKLLYVLLVCAITYWLLRSYKRKIDLKTSLELEKKDRKNQQVLNDERLRFYTNITHELRTPLTLILGPLDDLIREKNLSDPVRRKIDVIHASATRLLSLINRILEFRKTETQNRKLTVSCGNLRELVSEIGFRYKELNQNEKLTIDIDTEYEGAILYFDVDIVTTILNNLLSNAIKYTPQGRIRLSLRTVTKEENKPYAEISVSDTGYGIEEEALPCIFDRYYQAKGKHQSSGTGIGLALVKSLVELHEGSLHVESKVGEGSSFSVFLSATNTYPHALHTEKENNPAACESIDDLLKDEDENKFPVILVVEDDKDIREYITSSLTGDYNVLSAANGKEGLELALKHIPRMVISDIMMPVMNGIELCRKLKADIRTSHIPVILLTAKDSTRDKEEGYESGADSYLTKPFNARLLHVRIHNLMELRNKLAKQINTQAKGVAFDKKDRKEGTIKLSRLDEEFLAKFTEVIEKNLANKELDISFIKDKMYMSYSTFYRKVKGLTGGSPNDFIRKIRLKKSIQLLLSGSYNVTEVAYMSGFSDVVYFRKCFKEEYGVAPSEYIKTSGL